MIDIINNFEYFEETPPPSKSQRKREMTALQDLGARLVKLTKRQLQSLDLPPELLQAVQAAQQMTKREAQRRQIQYIGRVMRDIDEAAQLRIKKYFDALG